MGTRRARSAASVDAGAVAALAARRALADALAREPAVAALGELGDPAGLPAMLKACRDKPAVRRRAVLALAAFEGPEVEAALEPPSTTTTARCARPPAD